MRRFPPWTIGLGSLLLTARASAEPPPDAPPKAAPDAPPAEPPAEPNPTEATPEPQPSPDGSPEEAAPPVAEPTSDEDAQKPDPESAAAPAASTEPPEEEEDLPPVIPDAADTRGGHLTLGGFAGLTYPFGTIEQGVSLGDSTTIGPSFGADLGIGVSRTTVLGAYGELALPGSEGPCTSCSPRSIAAGLFVRYHLVQGLSFDPWMQAGVGLRLLSFGDDVPSYTAVDWLRVRVGGDWYPFSNIGLGPIFEMGFGTPISTSEGSIQNRDVVAEAVLGLRLVLDVPGK